MLVRKIISMYYFFDRQKVVDFKQSQNMLVGPVLYSDMQTPPLQKCQNFLLIPKDEQSKGVQGLGVEPPMEDVGAKPPTNQGI